MGNVALSLIVVDMASSSRLGRRRGRSFIDGFKIVEFCVGPERRCVEVSHLDTGAVVGKANSVFEFVSHTASSGSLTERAPE